MKDLEAIKNLEECLKFFPSIGEKTAERMAYSVLNMSKEKVDQLVFAINDAKSSIHHCPICGLLTEDPICQICTDTSRDHSQCVVLSNDKDVLPFEKMGDYNGTYHVLGGDISPSKNIGPENLRIEGLLERIKKENIKEIIIATNPTIEGETTALYLARVLLPYNISVSRLGMGLPVGGQLDYVDELTISRALKGRTKLN